VIAALAQNDAAVFAQVLEQPLPPHECVPA
jgi:hypothetical protein